jgi:carboxyl-terminal processing protease
MKRRTQLIATAAAVLAAFGAGTATGALSRSHPASGGGGGSVIDEAERTIAAHAAKPVSRSALQSAAVQGMLKALDDHWSAYYSQNDFSHFQQVLSGTYTGVGVWVRRTASGSLRVTNVQSPSPAATAGVRTGDVVLDVADHAVRGHSVAAVVSRLRGDPGSDVSVRLRRGSRPFTVSLRRAAVSDDDVSASMLAPGVEQLRVTAFTRGVGSWVRAKTAAAQRRHLRGLVLDLRDDPGGLLDEAVDVASAFVAKGPVVSFVERGHAPKVLDAEGGANTTMPLVVLVDGGTASAAEIVTGALQDRGRAVVVGSQTFGKGSVQEPSVLSDGSALELTVGHYLTPSGRSLDGVGIAPDVTVPAGSPASVVDQRALEVLTGLTADTGSAGPG